MKNLDVSGLKLDETGDGDKSFITEDMIFGLPKNVKDRVLLFLTLKERLGLRLVSKKFCDFEKEPWIETEGINIQKSFESWFPKAIGNTTVKEIGKMLHDLLELHSLEGSKVRRLVNWKVPLESSTDKDPQVLCLLLNELTEGTRPPILDDIREVDVSENLVAPLDLVTLKEVFPKLETLVVRLDNLHTDQEPDDPVTFWNRRAFESIPSLQEMHVFVGGLQPKICKRE